MITPYKGKVQIDCTKLECPKDKLITDVLASCLNCEFAEVRILDFDNKTLGTRKKFSKKKVKKEVENGF